MKRSTFKQPSYEEIIRKREEKKLKILAERPPTFGRLTGLGTLPSKKKLPRKETQKYKELAAPEPTDDVLEERFKKEVRERDGCHCQFPRCRYQDDHIDVHHIAERSLRKDLIYTVTNGICVCRKHHTWIHNNMKKAIQMGLLSIRSRELAAKEGTLGIE